MKGIVIDANTFETKYEWNLPYKGDTCAWDVPQWGLHGRDSCVYPNYVKNQTDGWSRWEGKCTMKGCQCRVSRCHVRYDPLDYQSWRSVVYHDELTLQTQTMNGTPKFTLSVLWRRGKNSPRNFLTKDSSAECKNILVPTINSQSGSMGSIMKPNLHNREFIYKGSFYFGPICFDISRH